MRRRILVSLVLTAVAVAGGAVPAWACGGLVAPNGTVRLLRTSTLAAYADGIEHYVTSFEFAGGGAELGSIVPLPGVPTKVERGGDWTLQRLVREVNPIRKRSGDDSFAAAGTSLESAEVLLETRIDALDLTVLRGGARAVGEWARDHGFLLPPDAPEVLEHYAAMSPIFLAARFDTGAAGELGQGVGDGTPIHLTIPTDHPWVPLRILGLGRTAAEVVEADVFLLTESRPERIDGTGAGVRIERIQPASASLLADLRSDQGMEWVPDGMWLTHVDVDARASGLTGDLAVDPPEKEPAAPPPAPASSGTWWWGVAALVAGALGFGWVGTRRVGTPVPA